MTKEDTAGHATLASYIKQPEIKFVYLIIQLWLTIKPKKNRKNVGFIAL